MIESLRRFDESEVAKQRDRIIRFYTEFGEKATKEAFGVDRKLIKKWQNDNGHENLGLFQQRLKQDGIKQVFSYPRCPKINAYIERFNRTLREEFLNINGILIKEKNEFDKLLIDWLVYYNSKRPHFSLNLKAPLQYILNNYRMSHMCLTKTLYLKNKLNMLKYYNTMV